MITVNQEELQSKLDRIEHYYQKFRIIGRECPYILGIRVHNNEPLITLVQLRYELLIKENILSITIPGVVEAIDQQRWINFDLDADESSIKSGLVKINLIGNNKPIHGSLRGAFQAYRGLINGTKTVLRAYDAKLGLYGDKYRTDDRQYTKFSNLKEIKIQNFDGQNIRDISCLAIQAPVRTKINVEDLNLKVIEKADNIEVCGNILGRLLKQGVRFENIDNLNRFQNSIEAWRTSEVIDLSVFNFKKLHLLVSTFENCKNLKAVKGLTENDLGTDLICRNTFYGCESLKEVPEALKFVSIADAHRMFGGCKQLERVQELSTYKAHNVDYMYYGCSQIKEIVISGYDYMSRILTRDTNHEPLDKLVKLAQGRPEVQPWYLQNMFVQCTGVKRVHIENINLNGFADLNHAFSELKNLEELLIDDIKIDAGGQVHPLMISALFKDCTKLKKVTIKNIEQESDIDMQEMFKGCKNLESVTLENITIRKITSINEMFESCPKLKVFNMDKVRVQNINLSGDMASWCKHQSIEGVFGSSDISLFIGKLSKLLKYDRYAYKSIMLLLSQINKNLKDEVIEELANSFIDNRITLSVTSDNCEYIEIVAILHDWTTGGSKYIAKIEGGRSQVLKLVNKVASKSGALNNAHAKMVVKIE